MARGQYRVAAQMVGASLEARREVLGVDDAATLNCTNMLAVVLQYQGKYEEAEEMNRRALAGCEKALGMDHPSSLTSVNKLAFEVP
jgi:hypothetical protein